VDILQQAKQSLYDYAVAFDFVPEDINYLDDYIDWVESKDTMARDEEENAEYSLIFLEGVEFALNLIKKD
jgi:hypothetical protein